MTVILQETSADDPHSRERLRALYTEQLTLYPQADEPAVDPSAFTRPVGVFLVAADGGEPVGCGGIHTCRAEPGIAEIRKMYVRPRCRGFGIGYRILTALETVAVRDIRAHAIMLETGIRNHTAIRLYEAAGYLPIPSYADGRDRTINRVFKRDIPYRSPGAKH